MASSAPGASFLGYQSDNYAANQLKYVSTAKTDWKSIASLVAPMNSGHKPKPQNSDSLQQRPTRKPAANNVRP